MRTADFEAVMAEQGLIAADAPPLPFGAEGRPWYVSLVLGGAGWLASVSTLVFVVLLFKPDTAAAYMVLGAIMLAAGFGLYRADRENAFFEQLALALSLAGQLALMYAVGDATDSAVVVAAFTTALSVAMVLWLPNHFAKMLSAFFACLAWALVIRLGWWGENVFDQGRLGVALVPALVGWFLIWVPIGIALHTLIAREAQWMAAGTRRIARPALTGLMLALSVGTWASEPFAVLPRWTPPGEVLVNWLALWPLLGVAAALFAGVCAFRLRHRAMIGVAIAGALLYVVQFYYLLGVSLVVKSYIMLAVGVGLLLAARAMRTRDTGTASGGGGAS
jgi:hypothetical protein